MEFPNNSELLIYSQSNLIESIKEVNRQIDELRPLSEEKENKIMQKLRLDWNYNSNAIEGNSLDYGETVAFLMHGVTAKGKPLKDFLDIRGHNEAINYIIELIKHNEEITEKDIRSLHEVVLVESYKSPAQTLDGQKVHKTIQLGKYKSLPNHVKTVTGETHYYSTPEDTPILMADLMNWYRSVCTLTDIHPVIIASVFHHRFVSIHPFDDGNGRMARLLMNMILMKHHYPPVVIKKESKDQYYSALSQADTGTIEPFISYVSEGLLYTLELYLKGAKGESIEEPVDLDKKLMLFKKEVEARNDRIEVRKSADVKRRIMHEVFEPFLSSYASTVSKFKELFLDYSEYKIHMSDGEGDQRSWKYTLNDINDFSSNLSFIEQNDSLLLCSRFSDFKTKSNTFSFEVKVLISFYELEYTIFYSISPDKNLINLSLFAYPQWLKRLGISKFYHKIPQSTEIESSTAELGDNIFSYIQNIYNNPEINDLSISQSEIEDNWSIFIELDYKNDELTKANFKLINEIVVSKNRISLDIHPTGDDMDQFWDMREEVASKFRKYLIKHGLVNNFTIVHIH